MDRYPRNTTDMCYTKESEVTNSSSVVTGDCGITMCTVRARSVTTSATSVSPVAETIVSYTQSSPRISPAIGVTSIPDRSVQPLGAPQTIQIVPHYQATNQSLSSIPMTVSNQKAQDRPGLRNMDRNFPNFDISPIPQTHTCGDQFVTDFSDTSIYATSPKSLYSYDQEKVDMQITFGGPTCTTCTANSTIFSDDFELKTQYEASRDISHIPLAVPSSINSQVSATVAPDDGGTVWELNSKEAEQTYLLKPDKNDTTTGPTLAALNFSLLDDIDNYISVDMNQSRTLQENVGVLKGDNPISQGGTYTEMTPVDNSCNRTLPSSMNMSNVTPQMSFSATQFTVKTEPVDLDIGHGTYGMAVSSPIPNPMIPTKSGPSTLTSVSVSAECKSTLQKLLQSPAGYRLQTVLHMPKKTSEIVAGTSRKRSVSAAGFESMDEKWEDIKQFIHNTTRTRSESLSSFPQIERRERQRVDSTSSQMTLTSNEDLESYQGEDSDSDHNDFDESQSDSDMEGGCDISALDPTESLVGGTKEKQYFWQYNVQSKGPKGTRVHFEMEEDPHVLRDFEDPVFDPNTSNVAGVGVSIKHGGKARKGDGNDIVPNPKKLCLIGLQLRKISRHINDFAPVSELPSPMRSKKRKEKNKLASRACRLKKKAQHEAHKVKLHGLELEHRQLLGVLKTIQRELLARIQNKQTTQDDVPMADRLQQIIKENLTTMIAGNTTDFVNSVVRKVEEGDPTGGIEVRATRSYPKELHN